MGFHIGIHPVNDVAFLDIEGMLVFIGFKDHLGEDPVDGHHPLNPLYTDSPVLYVNRGAGADTSGLYVFYILFKCEIAVL